MVVHIFVRRAKQLDAAGTASLSPSKEKEKEKEKNMEEMREWN